MKPIILFCMAIITLYSCNNLPTNCKKTEDIVFKNQKPEKVDLTIFNGADSVLISAEGKSTEKGILCFDKNGADGSFTINLKSALKDTTIYNWGYFTNGAPSGSALTVIYDNNAVTIKESPLLY